MQDKICAGIVLYNPDEERLKHNIEAIYRQISEIILIDNHSLNNERIKAICGAYNKLNVVWNQENKGIAAALNQIVEYAYKNSYQWVLLLDQDSVASGNLIEQYGPFLVDDQVSVVCPQIVDINLSNSIKEGVEEIVCSTDVITSGSCINVMDCIQLGGFDERLFIDFVDTDYQERCLRSGKHIIRNNDAVLFHEVGWMKEKRVFGFKVLCSNHSPMRRYYMVRNRLYFRKQYFGTAAYIKEKIRLLLGTVKICIYEEEKIEKIKATMKGFRDYRELLH